MKLETTEWECRNAFLFAGESSRERIFELAEVSVLAHIEHIRKVAGVDHVGIGAGFDGINFVPSGLEDVSKYPVLIGELLKNKAWSEHDVKKLVGFNFIRVFRQVETVREELKRVPPIEEWMPKSNLEGHPTTCAYYGGS